jgi:hypothetical protein
MTRTFYSDGQLPLTAGTVSGRSAGDDLSLFCQKTADLFYILKIDIKIPAGLFVLAPAADAFFARFHSHAHF